MHRGAKISLDGLYRWSLSRTWDTNLPVMAFVMLNPSTANAMVDDPTIGRCIGFAKREGCGGIIVVNLFALRSPDPRALRSATDPVGRFNEVHMLNALLSAKLMGGKVVVGWGSDNHPALPVQSLVLSRLADQHGVELLCLGTNKNGSPKHPLYLRADAPLIPWRHQ